jgi:cardiolipin synthase
MMILVTVLITVLVTVFLMLLALNLRSPEQQMTRCIKTEYNIGDEQFWRVMSHLLGPPIVGGNTIRQLVNGDQIFGAMLAGIRSAQKTVTFETYVYWSGEIGKEFCAAFCERAMAGVKVHVLLDALGTQSMDKDLLAKMEECKVEVEHFHPIRWYNLFRMNHRTHRKLLIIDGVKGFIGGVGIADEWTGNARNTNEYRDTHFEVAGPVVAQLQAAFSDNWLRTHARVLHEVEYFPRLEPVGEANGQVFTSSPQGGSASASLMYMLSIAAAKKHILIENSYFVPDETSVEAFCQAIKRGVSVKIIVPGPEIDMTVVRTASRAQWGKLLEAGVEIYEYLPTMFHCKILIIDDLWVSVGSTNFDNRSFRLNDEANLNVIDAKLAAELTAQFEEDLRVSVPITLNAWRNRPKREKLVENLAHLVRGQL